MNLGYAKPSALRVLLWKEWRQQRWTLAGMTALALALFVMGEFIPRWSFDLSFAAFVFAVLGVPLVLSAQSFAAEDEDATAVFLMELPFRPLQVFSAKLLVIVLASWAATGLLLLLELLRPGYPESAVRSLPWVPAAAAHAWRDLAASVTWVGIWLLAPTAAVVTSLLASLGLRPLTTALLGAAWLCLCIACGVLSVLLLAVAQARGLVWFSAAVTVPASAVLLAAWLSARRHPRKLVQFLRGVGGCAAVPALFILPGALPHAYTNLLKPPTYYVRSDWWHRSPGWVNSVSVPRTSRPAALALEIALECESDSSRDASLLALLDLSTGRTAWSGVWPAPVDRAQRTLGGYRAVVWSPDGSRVTWEGGIYPGLTEDLAWPTYREETLPGLVREAAATRAELRVYDVRRRRTLRVPGDLATDVMEQCNSSWYNATWLVAPWLKDPGGLGLVFVNTDDGSAHVCPVPLPGHGDVANHRAGMVVLPDRAVFVAVWRGVTCEGALAWPDLVITRSTPSAASATILQVRDLPPGSTELRAVSPDAQWALLAPDLWNREGPPPNLALVDLGTGATRPLVLPPGVLEHMARPWGGPLTAVFATGGTRVLVDLQSIYAVYDLGGDTWQMHVPPVPADTAAQGWGTCVSPNGERVLQVFSPDRGSAGPQAVILDLVDGTWTTVPLAFHSAKRDVRWCGNEHVLDLHPTGVWRFGLDGSRELLYRCTALHPTRDVAERAAEPGLAGLVAWCRHVLEEDP